MYSFRIAAAVCLAITFFPTSNQLSGQQVLQRDDARDLARLTATSVELANRLREVNSPEFNLSSKLLSFMKPKPEAVSQYMMWHEVSLNVTALDHAPAISASPGSFHEQFGPARTSRALALVHLAMFEAANAYALPSDTRYESYLRLPPVSIASPAAGVAQTAAIVEAAYGTLAWLYPGLVNATLPTGQPEPSKQVCLAEGSPTGRFSLRRFHACSLQLLATIKGGESSVASGLAYGKLVVAELIKLRRNDGSSEIEPSWGSDFVPINSPDQTGLYPVSQWQKDPVSNLSVALGGRWGDVTPFALTSAAEFRVSDEHSAPGRFDLLGKNRSPRDWPSYLVVSEHGTDKRLNTPPNASMAAYADLYYVAKFWAYDGTAGLCAPARLYNQLADVVLKQAKLSKVGDIARFYGLVNLAMADAGVAAWESKYYFQFARPVTAIRSQKAVDDQLVKELWFPLGAQNTNASVTYNITPPFPSYPSGHAVFGGALFGILRQFVPANAPFNFQSDEFNGLNKDVYNFIRCKDGDNDPAQPFCNNNGKPRGRTLTLDCAERENADSRIWMGVHWIFDADDGILLGNQVARATYNRVFQPVGNKQEKDLSAFEEKTSGRPPLEAEKFRVLTTAERAKLTCKDLKPHLDLLLDIEKSYPKVH